MSEVKVNYIKSLYPTTKFIFVICFSIVVIVVTNYYALVSLFLLLNILAICSRSYKIFITTVIKQFTAILIIVIIMQGLFYKGDTVLFSFWILSIKLEGILYAIGLALMILNIGSALLLFFNTTSVKDFVFALEYGGLSSKAAFVVLSTLQMFNVLKLKSTVIMNAQKCRGVETEGNLIIRAKAFIPILLPLILSSIASTEEKALTLEARGFSIETKRSYLSMLEKRKADIILPKIFIIITALIIVWRIICLLLK